MARFCSRSFRFGLNESKTMDLGRKWLWKKTIEPRELDEWRTALYACRKAHWTRWEKLHCGILIRRDALPCCQNSVARFRGETAPASLWLISCWGFYRFVLKNNKTNYDARGKWSNCERSSATCVVQPRFFSSQVSGHCRKILRSMSNGPCSNYQGLDEFSIIYPFLHTIRKCDGESIWRVVCRWPIIYFQSRQESLGLNKPVYKASNVPSRSSLIFGTENLWKERSSLKLYGNLSYSMSG